MLVARALVRRIDIVINRKARYLRGESPLREALLGDARGAHVHETSSLAELDQVARTIARRGTDCVVLAGGDGSYMAGVTALARELGDAFVATDIALAPGGTVSTVARNWGFHGSAIRHTRSLVRGAIEGTARATLRNTLRARDDAGGDRLGFIFGAGLVAKFFDEYYASPHQGYAGAARIVARIFAGSFTSGALAARVLTPTPCVLYLDGEEQRPRAWSLIASSVVRDLGLHMWLTHRASEEPDRIHAVASTLPPRALGPQMFRVLAGRRLRGDDHVDTLTGELRVVFGDEAGAYVFDGELLRARDVRVSAGPRIRVLSV